MFQLKYLIILKYICLRYSILLCKLVLLRFYFLFLSFYKDLLRIFIYWRNCYYFNFRMFFLQISIDFISIDFIFIKLEDRYFWKCGYFHPWLWVFFFNNCQKPMKQWCFEFKKDFVNLFFELKSTSSISFFLKSLSHYLVSHCLMCVNSTISFFV